MKNVLVFVYGTLKTGCPLNRVMQEAGGVSKGEARSADSPFVLVSGYSYPYAVPVSKKQRAQLRNVGVDSVIRGELFVVPETGLQVLDGLEGYPTHYNRSEISVCIGRYFDELSTAFIYHRNESLRDGDDVCTEGVWWPYVRVSSYRKAVPANQPQRI